LGALTLLVEWQEGHLARNNFAQVILKGSSLRAFRIDLRKIDWLN